MLIGYMGCFFVPALMRSVFKDDPVWEIQSQRWIWYSLAGTAAGMACWLALGDGNWLVRLLATGWAFVCMWLAWQLAVYVAFYGEAFTPGSTKAGFSYGPAGLAVFALAITFTPLAVMRLVLGMRLVRPGELGPLLPTPRQFTLKQLLCAIAIVGVTLGLARVIAPVDLSYFVLFTIPWKLSWFTEEAACYSITAIPTAICMAFYPRRLHWALVYFVVTFIAVTFLRAFPSMGWTVLRRVNNSYHILSTVNYSAVLLVYASLLLFGLRALSYRLQWRRSKAASDDATTVLATSSN